jgi:hypothetical protein
LNLTPQQVAQAETQKRAADGAVIARLPETYQWLLVPVQAKSDDPQTWEALKLSGVDGLAVRASKKLRSDELLLPTFAATRLKMELDKIPLWRNDCVATKQLVEYFARYVYLPRLRDPSVLLNSISEGLAMLTWEHDTFAFADSFDEVSGRYIGLRGGCSVNIHDADSPGMIVKAGTAKIQLAKDLPKFEDGSKKPVGWSFLNEKDDVGEGEEDEEDQDSEYSEESDEEDSDSDEEQPDNLRRAIDFADACVGHDGYCLAVF